MKNKHFSCQNCKKVGKVTYTNGAAFCSGLVKHPKPKCDLWRLCISKKDVYYKFDIMKEEVVSIIQLLSSSLLQQMCKEAKNNETTKSS